MSKNYTRRKSRFPKVLLLLLVLALLAVATYRFLPGLDNGAPPDQESPQEVSTEPQTPAQTITTSTGILCRLTDVGEDAVYQGDLILVNNKIPFHFPENQEESLLCVLENKTRDYIVRDGTVLLQPAALDALNRMMADFKALGYDSRTVNVVAGHRTAEFQQHLFDQGTERNGLDHAERFIAHPGGSEHHTGYALDFDILLKGGAHKEYDGKGDYAWINQNCQKYGFVVRFAKEKMEFTGIDEEAWHFRYVGVPHATLMVEKNLCLEEYIDYLREIPVDGEHLSVMCEDGTYEIWYCPAGEVYVPADLDYTLSGNNVDGVIVTVQVG